MQGGGDGLRKKQQRLQENGRDGYSMFASGHGVRAVGGLADPAALSPYQPHLQEGARGPHMSGYPMQHPGMAMSGGMQGTRSLPSKIRSKGRFPVQCNRLKKCVL